MGQAFMSQIKITSPLRMRSDLHLIRKVWHISTGLIGLLVYKKAEVTPEFTASILLGLAVAAFLFELLRLRNSKVNQLAMIIMKPVMRESERNSVSGLPFYALGVSLSLFYQSYF